MEQEQNGIVRNQLGFWSVVLFGINGIIGSGIFLLPNTLMKSFGPASTLIFILDGILALLIGFAFAECAGLFKEMGGAYLYAKEAFGDFVGYEVGFVQWAVRIITQGAMYVGFATALAGFLPDLASPMMKNVIVTVMSLILMGLNLTGNGPTALVNNIITVGKLIPIFLVIVVGLFTFNVQNFQPFFIPELTNAGNFSKTALLLFFAFGGFEAVALIAGEVKNPTKNVPRALLVIIGTVVTVYFLIQIAAISLLGTDLTQTVVPMQDGVARVLGRAGSSIVAAGTLVSMGGITVATSYAMPRSGEAMAEQGMMPKALAKKNAKGVPYIAVFVSTALSLLVAYSGSFEMLAQISSVSTFGQYIPTCLAVIVFRKKMKDAPRHFKIPFGPILPLIAVVLSVWLLANADWISLVGGLGAFLVAVPFYFLTFKLRKKE